MSAAEERMHHDPSDNEPLGIPPAFEEPDSPPVDSQDSDYATLFEEENLLGITSQILAQAFKAFYPVSCTEAYAEVGHEPAIETPADELTEQSDSKTQVSTFETMHDFHCKARREEIQQRFQHRDLQTKSLLELIKTRMSAAVKKDRITKEYAEKIGLGDSAQILMGPFEYHLEAEELEAFPPSMTATLTNAKEYIHNYQVKKSKRTGNYVEMNSAAPQPVYLPLKTASESVRHVNSKKNYKHVKGVSKTSKRSENQQNTFCDTFSVTRPKPDGSSKRRLTSAHVINPELRASDNDEPLFIATPNPIRFTEYGVGGCYHTIISVQNISCSSRRLRIVGPQTRYFSFDKLRYPQSETGVVAPGLFAELRVTFNPDSGGEYLDYLCVECESDQRGITASFQVPIIATRYPPQLSISAKIVAAPSLVGSSSVIQYTCVNFGENASFRVFPHERWLELGFESIFTNDSLVFSHSSNECFRRRYAALLAEVETSSTVCTEYFKLSPSHFSLSKSQQIQLIIEFLPCQNGIHQAQFVILCDNCVAQAITIEGTGVVVDFHFGRIDDGKTSSDTLRFTEAESLSFPPTLIGFDSNSTQAKKLFEVVKKTLIDLPFSWEVVAGNGLETENDQECFQIHPSNGVLREESTFFRSTFTPVIPGAFRGKAMLRLHQIPRQSLPANAFDIDVDSTLTDFKCLELSLSGIGRSGEFVLEPKALSISTVTRGKSAAFKVSLRNDQSAPIQFAWQSEHSIRRKGLRGFKLDDRYTQICSKQTSSPIDLVFDPSSGTIGAHSTMLISGVLTPTWSGPFSIAVPCRIPSLIATPVFERWLLLEGCVEQSQVRFLCSQVDFGFIATTSAKRSILTIRNDSMLEKASWRLTHRKISSSVSTKNNVIWSRRSSNRSRSAQKHSIESETKSISPRPWLSYDPKEGVLHPGMTADIVVQCHGGTQPEHFQALLSCHLEPETLFSGEVVQNSETIRARVQIERPNVYVTPQTLSLGTTFVGILAKKTVLLTNLSSLRCEFRWSEPQGPSSQYSLKFDPENGVLEPQGTIPTELHYTPLQDGEVSFLVACFIEGMHFPLGLECRTIQKGLLLSYEVIEASSIKSGAQIERTDSETEMALDLSGVDSRASLPTLSFGDAIPLGEPRALTLLIQNHSVATSLEIIPKRYKTAPSDAPNDPVRVDSTDQKRMKQLLALHQGLAIEIIPSSAEIPAWQQAFFTIVCYNNMPGAFADEIVISPKNHAPVELSMNCTIVGSPVVWSNPDHHSRQVQTLAFGQVTVFSPVIERIASFTNRTPQAINLRWRIAPVGRENMIVRVSIQVRSTGEAQVKLLHKYDTEAESPFVLKKEDQRSETSVPPFTKMNVTIAFTPTFMPASKKMYLLGDVEWRDVGDEKTQDARTPVGTALQVVRVANKSTGVRPQVSKETERDEGKRFPSLLLLLDAQVIEPLLIVDQLETSEMSPKTVKDCVRFKTYWPFLPSKTTAEDFHPWHRKVVHLMNPTKIPLAFHLACSGPFRVLKTPHRPTLNGNFGNKLLPQKFVKVELLMTLTTEAAAGHLQANTPSKLVVHGQLHIEFDQGTIQTLPLVVKIQRPILLVTPSVHNFGHVQLGRRRSLTLNLINPTPISLVFQIQHVASTSELFVPEQSPHNDDINVFHFERKRGVVEGPTMSLASVGSYLPSSSSSVKSALKPIVQMHIHFEPEDCSHYYSHFRFQVVHGNEVDLVLEGYGTLQEALAGEF
uniref:Uncharacterized protein AlNc14C238G9432 n=1 Tax=Albugo laibachii Nc14 TaxID=890382 RepID=F0WST6_9STRA|nr:conserved hypothetical protein [Albugo laibachii Nc14]|eukprot:CCA24414.1 conserved hypothetical protein [Albugo laibachii Nc14]